MICYITFYYFYIATVMPVKFPSIKLKLDLQHLLPILYRFFFWSHGDQKKPDRK
jgi:hypothetical protein